MGMRPNNTGLTSREAALARTNPALYAAKDREARGSISGFFNNSQLSASNQVLYNQLTSDQAKAKFLQRLYSQVRVGGGKRL
jgi:hypothetical protein